MSAPYSIGRTRYGVANVLSTTNGILCACAICAAAMQFVSYHTTYCNAINMWIAGCESTEEVQAIYYGADVPEQYQSDVLKAYIATKEGAGDKNAQTTE